MQTRTLRRAGLLTSLAALALGGCASPLPMGGIYTEVNLPVAAGEGAGAASKVGTAQCTSILGMVATGDCSIEAARSNGGIRTIRYVDWEAKNILGVYGTYTTKVRGD